MKPTRYFSTTVKSPLISTDELDRNFDQFTLVDGTWFMPNQGKIAREEYLSHHLEVLILAAESICDCFIGGTFL